MTFLGRTAALLYLRLPPCVTFLLYPFAFLEHYYSPDPIPNRLKHGSVLTAIPAISPTILPYSTPAATAVAAAHA